MKAYRKTIVITLVLTLFPVLVGLLLWNRLPEKMPTHWGLSGQVDGFSPKAQAIFLMPCIMAVGQIVMAFCIFADPKKQNIHRKPLLLSLWILPVVSILVNGASYLIALDVKISMTAVMLLMLAILSVGLGNYLPKLRQNYTVGIRVAWTLADADNWERTHRFTGKLMVFNGLLIFVLTLLSRVIGDTTSLLLAIILVGISSIVPILYSYLIYKKKI